MGNYFNELRWKIIRANNLPQFIHKVTLEIRFWKSLAQERFKSNLEFRNQIIVFKSKDGASVSDEFALLNWSSVEYIWPTVCSK